MRPIIEPGGVLLIGVGLRDDELHAAINRLYAQTRSLTVLVDISQQRQELAADEIWVYGAGLRATIALVRRISWRHFEAVYQPNRRVLPLLRAFVWPRPEWRF